MHRQNYRQHRSWSCLASVYGSSILPVEKCSMKKVRREKNNKLFAGIFDLCGCFSKKLGSVQPRSIEETCFTCRVSLVMCVCILPCSCEHRFLLSSLLRLLPRWRVPHGYFCCVRKGNIPKLHHRSIRGRYTFYFRCCVCTYITSIYRVCALNHYALWMVSFTGERWFSDISYQRA